jgi:thioredoxin 1
MERRILIASLASVLLLSGCGFLSQFTRPSGPTEEQRPPMTEPEKQLQSKYGEEGGSYQDYKKGVLGNGQESILFFAASWCPDCQKHDAALKDWFSANYIPLSVYKVDYDSSADLKAQYGVVQQDTFVRIDGQGNAVATKSFPSDLDLLNMLRP